MRLTRQGIERNCGITELITGLDGTGFTDGIPSGVMQIIEARRETRPENRTSSYRYTLQINTKDVLNLLFELDFDGIPEAVASLTEKWDVDQVIPELVQKLVEGLAKGVSSKPKIPKMSNHS